MIYAKLSVGDHVIIPFKDKKHWVGAWATDVYVNEEDCIQSSLIYTS